MSAVSSSRHIYYLMIIGVLVRLLAWSNTHVVNPDGTLYITQAKAIFYGQKEALYCGFSYLANYSLMIAGAHWLFADWVFSARLVSLLFGAATLVPLYLLLRRFVDPQVSALCTLLYAMLPVFAGGSIDLIRDPVCWFFVTMGLYLFVKGVQDNSHLPLLCSSLCFLMAAWSRIEASLFIVVSVLYLLTARRKGNLKSLVFFTVPLLVIGMSGLLLANATRKVDITARLRLNDIIDRFLMIKSQYQGLREILKYEASWNGNSVFGFFLSEARTNIWLVALGTLLNRFLESLLYIYAIPFVLGVRNSVQRISNNPVIIYFMVLISSTCLLLYIHVFAFWWMDYRHAALFIIPSAVLIAFGMDQIIGFVQNRLKLGRIVVAVILAAAIILSTLPKNLLPRDGDLMVFKEIGEFVGRREASTRAINISAPSNIHSWVSFYANLAYAGAACPVPTEVDCWDRHVSDMRRLVRHFEASRAQYFLWTERQWPAEGPDLAEAAALLGLRELGRWDHPMTGAIRLFEVGRGDS